MFGLGLCAMGRSQSMYLQLQDSASAFSSGGLVSNPSYVDTVYAPTTLSDAETAASSGYGTAGGYATGIMTAGTLHAYTSSFATYPTVGDPYNTNESSADGVVEETSVDTITISSSTLALGAKVNLLASLSLDGFFTKSGIYPNGVAAASLVSTSANLFALQISNYLSSTPTLSFDSTQSMVYSTYVGAKITFQQSLYVSSVSSADLTHNISSDSTDCSNTSKAFFQVLTPGASITSQSGASYAAVPEPKQFFSFGMGLILFSIRRKRRRD